MEKFEKTIKYVNLYNIYKSQLSNSQKEILSDYFFLDLSISEIAENRNISRSAVEDALSKGMSKLDELEKNLQILATNKVVLEKLEALKSRALNYSEIEEINEIEKDLSHGI